MDALLTTVCLNITLCNGFFPNNVSSADGVVGINFEPIIPISTSDTEKESHLADLRQQLNGQTIKVAVMEDFPLSYTNRSGPSPIGAGVAFQLLEFLTEKYNFTYELVWPEKEIYGSTDDMNGSLIEVLKTGKADMAAVFLPVMADAREHINFSTTTLDEGNWIMIMNRPGESATGSGLLAPFDRDVWLLILLSLLTVGPSIYGLIIIRMKLTRDKSQQIYPLPHCVWFVYGALMKQGSTLSPLADSTRLLFATWWIFITILTSFYTANLTAFLTLSKFTLPINNVDDILHKNQHFVSTRGGAVEYAIRNQNESLVSLRSMVLKNRGMFTEETNDSVVLTKYVEHENYVLIRDRPSIDHLIYKDYVYRKTIGSTDRIHCPFAISKTPFMTRKRSFAYNKDFIFKDLFDPELLHMVESGIVKYMLLENLPNAEICPQNLGGTERQLRNGDLMMTYQIMLAGFGTGFVIFVTELIFKILMNRKNHIPIYPFKGGKNKADPFKSVTPPPSYATLFNQSRSNNIWTTHQLQAKEDGRQGGSVHKFINGRQYKLVKAANGEQRLIPLRTPSAALFQYSYAN